MWRPVWCGPSPPGADVMWCGSSSPGAIWCGVGPGHQLGTSVVWAQVTSWRVVWVQSNRCRLAWRGPRSPAGGQCRSSPLGVDRRGVGPGHQLETSVVWAQATSCVVWAQAIWWRPAWCGPRPPTGGQCVVGPRHQVKNGVVCTRDWCRHLQ